MMWGGRSRANIHCVFPLICWSSGWTGPVVFGHARSAHMKVGNALMISITLSACQYATLRAACWYTPSWTPRRRSRSFLWMLWHFSIGSRNQTPSQEGCVERRSPGCVPSPPPPRSAEVSPSLVGPSPSPHLLCFALLPRELLEIPPRLLKGILHWHSAAISAGHAIWRRTPTTSFQSIMRLKNDEKEGKSLTGRRFFFFSPRWLERCQRGLEAVLQRRALKPKQCVFLAWQGLRSVFSVQITIVVGRWTVILF